MNFIYNSGSIFFFFYIILIDYAARVLLRRVAVKCAKYKTMRQLGMKLGARQSVVLRLAGLRLLLESYFDLCVCTMLNGVAFS